MEEISLQDINKAQRKASEKAIKLNRLLCLSYLEVKGSKLILVDPNGQETVIGRPLFGTRKVNRKRFSLDE